MAIKYLIEHPQVLNKLTGLALKRVNNLQGGTNRVEDVTENPSAIIDIQLSSGEEEEDDHRMSYSCPHIANATNTYRRVCDPRQNNKSSSSLPMSSSSQEYIGRSSSFPSRNLEWAPKCPCGYGYMVLKTSRPTSNLGRKFWKCSDLHGGKGCGHFIWMDEVGTHCVLISNACQTQMAMRMEEMKDSIEELRLGVRRPSESLETHMKRSRCKNRCAYFIAMLFLFAAYMWCRRNGRAYFFELM